MPKAKAKNRKSKPHLLSLNLAKNKPAVVVLLILCAIIGYTIYRAFAFSAYFSAGERTAANWNSVAPPLRQCESSNNPKAVSKSGTYRGLYQFGPSWKSFSGYKVYHYQTADAAPRNIQDLSAFEYFKQAGLSPWQCGKYAYEHRCYSNCGDSTGGGSSTPPPGPTPPPSGGGSGDCSHPTISQSNTGGSGCVKHLQSHLNNFGYGLSVDGQWGSGTNNAVRDFQSKHGLTVDGVVGTNTWNALHNGGGGGTVSGRTQIRGYEVDASGIQISPGFHLHYYCCNPNDARTDRAGLDTDGNPYHYDNLPAGYHEIWIDARGRTISGFTLCYDRTDCHSSNNIQGISTVEQAHPGNTAQPGWYAVVVNTSGHSYADLWFHFQ